MDESKLAEYILAEVQWKHKGFDPKLYQVKVLIWDKRPADPDARFYPLPGGLWVSVATASTVPKGALKIYECSVAVDSHIDYRAEIKDHVQYDIVRRVTRAIFRDAFKMLAAVLQAQQKQRDDETNDA